MKKETEMTTENHALRNARSWLATIEEAYAVAKKLWAGECGVGNAVEFDGIPIESEDELARWVNESALGVEVRDDWYAPGGSEPGETRKGAPTEFRILITTGGPALRIAGGLDRNGQPCDPTVEYRDSGEPWTPVPTTAEEDEALLWFCTQFYFGE